MASKRDKRMSVSDTVYVHETVTQIYTVKRFGSKKNAQYAAWDFLRQRVQKELKQRRVRAFFEGKAARIDGEEKDAVRAAQIEETRNEQRELLARLAALDAALAAIDPDFHGPQMAAHRHASGALGRMGLPRTEG